MRLITALFFSVLLFGTATLALPKDSEVALETSLTSTAADSTEQDKNVSQDKSEINKTSELSIEAANETPDVSSLVFDIDPSLNMSFGYEVSQGDVHLIIEMDHNPTQDQFIFGFHKAYPKLVINNVVFEKKHFGFNNKSVALLPMIEVENLGADAVKFILGTQVFRTHQRVNLSKIIREQSDLGLLKDTKGQLYKYSDMMEIQIFAKKSFNESRHSIKQLTYLGIPLENNELNKVYQIFGEQALADLTEIGTYYVGDFIQMPMGYKIPYRSKDTQWVIRPEVSSSEDLMTYELINNPKVGERFSITLNAEGIAYVLPEAKTGYMWVKVDESGDKATYILAQENAKLSPNILIKYVKSIIATIDSAHQKGQDLKNALLGYLQNSPLQIQPSRLQDVADRILKLNQMPQILQLLMTEQYYYPVLNLDPIVENSTTQCMSFLSH